MNKIWHSFMAKWGQESVAKEESEGKLEVYLT